MEYYEMKYPNGKMILPESSVDGFFEKIIVIFEDLGDVFPVERMELIAVSCVSKLVEGLEVLLKLPAERLRETFFDSLGFIMLVSEFFRIQFHKLEFSNIILGTDEMGEVVLGNMTFRIKNVTERKNYYFTYYDEDTGEECTKCMTGYIDYEEFLKIKEEFDEEKFALHMKKVTTVCDRMIRDRKNMLLKMSLMGI